MVTQHCHVVNVEIYLCLASPGVCTDFYWTCQRCAKTDFAKRALPSLYKTGD